MRPSVRLALAMIVMGAILVVSTVVWHHPVWFPYILCVALPTRRELRGKI